MYLEQAKPADELPYYVKLLLYGPPGAGKTYFAANAPNPTFVDVERSTETLRRVPDFRRIPVFTPKSFEEIDGYCREVVQKKKFDTIVIDTIGRAQSKQIREYLKAETQDGKKRSKYLALWGDYRVSTNMLDEFFVFLQDAPINLIFVAHADQDVDPETKNVKSIYPDLTPQLRAALTGLVNVVAYLDTSAGLGQIERRLTVNPYNKIIAKNRLNIQESVIKNPDFKSIFLGV